MKRCHYPFFFLALACRSLLYTAWRVLEFLAFFGCLLAFAMIVFCLWEGSCSWAEGFWALLVDGIVLACFWSVLRNRWRRHISQRLKSKDVKEPARQELWLPFSALQKRWESMAAIDADCVALEQEQRRLCWDDREWRNATVQGIGGEDWVAVFEYDAVSPLSGFRMAKICRQEGMQLPWRYCWMGADGMAIYRSGQLAVYPASRMEVLKSCFPMLAEDETFAPWLAESAKEGALAN